ncbi:gamma-glutamylcyclotransferase family protein [Thermoflavimicrobium daqui]|uniref:Gamma-glutamylcyclotransferase family protein n=1 Tax=Thermoflavimicrobium daqui TaxID=2137476 RepID=A0A364K2E3_9BACL|nr:gamma-glutamylcyclotransferase family protein [Thermoflavimicrobium daqui]RAL22501.1 gamma-glutamylcyclotransferase [Thermoflavimicrobium daqui]
MSHLIFVYGTLRTGEANHHFLQSAEKVAEQCWTEGALYITGTNPVMIVGSDSRVYGELYRITNDQLAELDRLELEINSDEKKQVKRITQIVHYDQGTKHAWMYVFEPTQIEGLASIPRGDWKCYQYLKLPELYYFAYGSCMDDERFHIHGCPHLFQDVVGRGEITGYSFRYTYRAQDGGRADIVEIGGTVEGKVYRVNQEALDYLYIREGAQRTAGIYRPAFVTGKINGEVTQHLLTFIVREKEEETAPPMHYLREIIRGAKGFVSDEYLNQLVKYHKDQFNLDILSLQLEE